MPSAHKSRSRKKRSPKGGLRYTSYHTYIRKFAECYRKKKRQGKSFKGKFFSRTARNWKSGKSATAGCTQRKRSHKKRKYKKTGRTTVLPTPSQPTPSLPVAQDCEEQYKAKVEELKSQHAGLLRNCQTDLNNLNASLESLKADYAKSQGEESKKILEKCIEANQEALAQKQEEYNSLLGRFHTCRQDLDVLRSGSQKYYADLQSEIDSLKNKLNQCKEDIGSSKSAFTNSSKDFLNIQKRLEETEAENKSLKDRIKILSQVVREKEKNEKDLEAELRKCRAGIGAYW